METERREIDRHYHREYEIFAVDLHSGTRRIHGVLADIHERGLSFFLPLQEEPPADMPLSQYLGLDEPGPGRVRITSQVLASPIEIDTRIVYQAKSMVLKDRYLIGLEFSQSISLPDAVLAIALQSDS